MKNGDPHHWHNWISNSVTVDLSPPPLWDLKGRVVSADLPADTWRSNYITARSSSDSKLRETVRKAIDNVRIEYALKICGNSCQDFHQTLVKWTKHSTQDKTFWWDRVPIGFYGEERIQALRNQLAISKATITMAITTANLWVSCPLVLLTW